VVTLLPGQVLNRHLQLIERVLHAEEIVQVEGEVHECFGLGFERVIFVTLVPNNVGVALVCIVLHIACLTICAELILFLELFCLSVKFLFVINWLLMFS